MNTIKALKTKLPSKGAALVEYGILVGLISVLAISAVLSLGEEIDQTFSSVEGELGAATSTALGGGGSSSSGGSGSTPPPSSAPNFAFTFTVVPGSAGSYVGRIDPGLGAFSAGQISEGIIQMVNFYTDGSETHVQFTNFPVADLSPAITLDCGSGPVAADNGASSWSDATWGTNNAAPRWNGNVFGLAPGVPTTCTLSQ